MKSFALLTLFVLLSSVAFAQVQPPTLECQENQSAADGPDTKIALSFDGDNHVATITTTINVFGNVKSDVLDIKDLSCQIMVEENYPPSLMRANCSQNNPVDGLKKVLTITENRKIRTFSAALDTIDTTQKPPTTDHQELGFGEFKCVLHGQSAE